MRDPSKPLPRYATRAAARGAELLDKAWPGWWRHIRLTRLRMISATHREDTCGCVLAQLDYYTRDYDFGSYDRGLVRLKQLAGVRTGKYRVGEVVNGFNISAPGDPVWDNLTEAWREEVRARRRQYEAELAARKAESV